MALGLDEAHAGRELHGEVQVLIPLTRSSQLSIYIFLYVRQRALNSSRSDEPEIVQPLSSLRTAGELCVPMNNCSEYRLRYRAGSGVFNAGDVSAQVPLEMPCMGSAPTQTIETNAM